MRLKHYQLYKRIAEETGLSLRTVQVACEAFVNMMGSFLIDGHTVQMSHFMRFHYDIARRSGKPLLRVHFDPRFIKKLDFPGAELIKNSGRPPKPTPMAIEGFGVQTEELSPYEMERLVPLFVEGLNGHQGRANSVTAKMIEYKLKSLGHEVPGSRVRKIINYIRRKGIVPLLLADNKGYWVSDDPKELHEYLVSLKQREDAMRVVRMALKVQAQNRWQGQFNFSE